ncbi:DEAD/DEAH box helicase family protein [Streptomyces diastaticus]|uniref:DEAD/DEAH box helicase n=1 Tax=Streptomyces TaxID=1883 RepID=UPI000C26872B|nr:DEAD/DEAH box helicase family protein [Streptomyces sp. TSRI0384-2]NEE29651.1 DEAD/DEAH box helicase family protein [Streptomyces sp. SID7982]PJM83066.1 helicase [Streptomyces sp. TSRI0384-2]QDD59918.1 DEAD/DEAH box helicase [Streptomyces albidoflavus]
MATNRAGWIPDERLVREVDDLFERATNSYRANSHLIAEHANQEESIRVGGYSNRTLLELVQNAADAMSGADEHEEGAGRVEIVLDLDRQTLYCANAGRPFSRSGLTTLAHAHLSGKRGDEIGRFGLGFKSVLAVTDAPQVFSRSIAFEFNSPKAKAALAAIAPASKRLPVLRTLTRIDADVEFAEDPILAELAEWAVTIVRLPRASRLENLRREIEEFRSEFLLFVNSVREVRLRVVGADADFVTSHVSRGLGDGRFRIERPDGDHEEWYVENRMHAPSPEARTEVGEAVSRDRMKVTVAMPARFAQLKTGGFWSYFPLQDRTSASALFNAPWSVNDDRTTLLANTYNREILVTLSGMFLDMLPKVSSFDDPAAHLDYMPARGRETHSFGDEILCVHIPQLGCERALIPDAAGVLRTPPELRPLDFRVSEASERDHEEWIKSPHTSGDVPHWRCYANNRRMTRLRTLYVCSVSSAFVDSRPRDEAKALEKVPKRGVLSWLREWAEGADAASAARALDFVLRNPRVDGIGSAKVIPTTDGMKSVKDRGQVFLHRVEGIEVEGSCFVDPDFLAVPGVEKKLGDRGFRDLDPLAKFEARMAKLSPESEDDELPKFWDAAVDVPIAQAQKVVAGNKAGALKVPTRDGGWASPEYVLDIDGLGDGIADRVLDRTKCVPQIAHAAGVITEPVASYSVEEEVHFDDYCQYVLDELNRRLGPGERHVEEVEFDKGDGPGPFSALLMLKEAEAPESIREHWTERLLRLDEAGYWLCTDVDTGLTHRVASPVRWAVDQAGLLKSSRGYRAPGHVVSASLVEYEALLPLFRGPRHVEDALALPKALDEVPAEVMRDALRSEVLKPIKNGALTGFVLTAGRTAFPDGRPGLIPARVGRVIEARRPDAVYLATTEEERAFLSMRQKPYLKADPDEAELLVEEVGCRRFEDSFSFSLLVDGRQGEERVIDLYAGLRSTFVEDKVVNATVAKAVQITKRVTTEDGVEDQTLEWHLEGLTLVVHADLDEERVLQIVNGAFDLRLSNAELSDILRARADQRLEEQRQAARAATGDAERLEIFFGDDTLKECLPKGLWQALDGQGLVDDSTSVAELFLTVYGSDSIRFLKDQFSVEGYTDVPTAWAGGASTVAWLRKMGFGTQYAGRRGRHQDEEFVVPGAVRLNPLHDFQKEISRELKEVLTSREADGRARKGMVELPTGAGKTRVATETVLRLFVDGDMSGTVIWIAQSEELCEQAVQTFETVWRWLGDERPLTIGRLWNSNVVHEPDTEFSVVVATDAKLDRVADTPEYEWLSRASAVFIDEAHRAGGSKMYTKILRWLGVDGRSWERPLVGVSATPFKGKSDVVTKPTEELAARFGHHIMRAFGGNAYEELSKRGVLARVRHEVLKGVDVALKPDELEQVQSWRKLEPKVLDRIGRDQARMRILVEDILRRDPEWPILVFTPNVLSAQVLAATLRYRQVAAEAVSGQTGRQARRDVIEKFKKGEIRVLANCDLLIQGFDAPGVRALYIARPTFSPSAYIQMAGRGLRGPANGGKPECLIVDVADNFGAVNDFLGYRAYEDLWRKQGA